MFFLIKYLNSFSFLRFFLTSVGHVEAKSPINVCRLLRYERWKIAKSGHDSRFIQSVVNDKNYVFRGVDHFSKRNLHPGSIRPNGES